MVEDLLIEVLESTELPVYRQGSMAEEESYPESFLTFWNNNTQENFYDNTESEIRWDYSVNVYTAYPEKLYEIFNKAKKLLKEVGFIVTDAGHDVASDEKTHIGRGFNVAYLEKVR